MAIQPLDPRSWEWFVERVHCSRLWQQWTKTPADPHLRLALVESLEKLGLSRTQSSAITTSGQ